MLLSYLGRCISIVFPSFSEIEFLAYKPVIESKHGKQFTISVWRVMKAVFIITVLLCMSIQIDLSVNYLYWRGILNI